MRIKKKAIALVLTLLVAMQVVIFSSSDAERVNMALNRQAEASSVYGPENTAEKGNDGINLNSWYTYWAPSEEDGTPWWQVDLRLDYKIDSVELEHKVGDESDTVRKNFRVLGSNDIEFNEYVILAQQGDSAFKKDSVWTAKVEVNESYRYVRVEKTKAEPFNIGEFRVWVRKDSIAQGIYLESEDYGVPDYTSGGRYTLPPDIEGTGFEQPVLLLSALNIMRGYENGDFKPRATITRAEFVTSAVRLMGLTEIPVKDESPFDDVYPNHWAYNSIMTATNMGLISGMGDGTFLPDEKITAEQALKILVAILGYDGLADMRGGYPEGYMITAVSLGLSSKLQTPAGDAITRGEVAWMMATALETDILKKAVFSNGEYRAEQASDINLLSENFGILKGKGKVTGNKNTLLNDGENSLADGYIKIDEFILSVEGDEFDEFIGLPVTYYYQATENRLELLFADKRIKSITVAADDINDFNDDNIFKYTDEDEKEKHVRISLGTDLIYNKKALREYGNRGILPREGEVKLFDTDYDDVIDLMVISASETVVVNWVRPEEDTVYLKNSQTPLKLDFTNDIIEIRDSHRNRPVELGELKEWNVLNIFESKNTNGKKIYRILVSDQAVRGTAAEVWDDGVQIRDKEYKLSYVAEAVQVGTSGTFYLDSYGKIVVADGKQSGQDKYGYLMTIGTQRQDMEDRLVAEIFTQDGEIGLFNLNKNALFDGESYSNVELIKAQFQRSGRIQGELHQAIRFSRNQKGEITEIDTIQQGPNEGEDSFSHGVSSLTQDGITAFRRFYFDGIFDCDVALGTDTVILAVPDDMSRVKDFKTMSVGELKRGAAYIFDGYDLDNTKTMGLMLMTSSGAYNIDNASNIMLVDRIVNSWDGELERNKLVGWSGNKQVEYYEYDTAIFANEGLEQGDIIQFSSSGDEIVAVRRLFLKSSDEPGEYAVSPQVPEYARTTSQTAIMSNNFYIGYGQVASRGDDVVIIKFTTNTGPTLRESIAAKISESNINIYVYDKEKKETRLGTPADFVDAESVGEEDGDMAFFHISSVLLKNIVLFK